MKHYILEIYPEDETKLQQEAADYIPSEDDYEEGK